MDFLEHAFKGSVKKEYNIEYYKTHKDKWKKTLKEQLSSDRKLRRNIKISKKKKETLRPDVHNRWLVTKWLNQSRSLEKYIRNMPASLTLLTRLIL